MVGGEPGHRRERDLRACQPTRDVREEPDELPRKRAREGDAPPSGVHLQRLSLAYHRARPQGDPLYRMSSDAYGFQTILNIVVGNVLVSVITLVNDLRHALHTKL